MTLSFEAQRVVMSERKTFCKSLEFTWKIENYSQQKLKKGPGEWISSKSFLVDTRNVGFHVKFYPQGNVKSNDNEKWASLDFMKFRNEWTTSHHVEISILDADGEKFSSSHFHRKITVKSIHNYGIRNFRNRFKKINFDKFIRVTDLENPVTNLLPNDTLTIFCRLEKTKNDSDICNCLMEKTATTRARRKLGQDLASLLDDKYSDFVFKVENVKIAAHRVILAARSPVFDAMFQHDMKEKRTNETEIEDATPAAFKALLRFIYTGHCEVGMLAEELLVAANKYDIQDLKEICAKELHKKLTVDNAVHLLILSDLHQANDLKRAAIRFINKNAEYVMKTASWFNLLKCFKIFSKCVLGKLGTRLSGLLKSNQNKLDYALSSH